MNSKKILIVAPSWVGDTVMAQSLLKLLTSKHQGLQIDVLAPEWSLPILGRMPEVSEAYGLDVPHGKLQLSKRIKMARKLRKNNYQQAIVLPNSWKSALIPFLAKIPVRTGWLGEARWGLINDLRYLKKDKLPRMVERYVALGLDKNSSLPEDFPTPALSISKNIVAKQKKVLALCPGAAYGSAKRWPARFYANIAEQKIKSGWDVWLFGSNQDKPVIEEIQQLISSETRSLAGQIDLLQTVDHLAATDAVVTNDSGLMHIAASLNKPLVAIYGSTSPKFTPPLGKFSKILYQGISCSPCFKRECPLEHFKCMLDISPAKVLTALEELSA